MLYYNHKEEIKKEIKKRRLKKWLLLRCFLRLALLTMSKRAILSLLSSFGLVICFAGLGIRPKSWGCKNPHDFLSISKMLLYGRLKKTKPLYFFQKICYNNYRKNGKGGQKIMDLLLMRALLIIAKYCA